MAKPYEPKDRFYLKAKAQGLRARSAFKIEELADRMGVVKPGIAVLDLGAAPGGWLQVLAKLVGPSGLVIGVDLVEIKSLSLAHAKTLVADVTAPDFPQKLAAITPRKLDLVTSDMAPKTTGIRATDEARSLELCEIALRCAEAHLRPGGAFITKVFMGGDFKRYETQVRKRFEQVKVMRPEATRDRSFEVYITAKGFRPPRP
ncbi:MAG: RlmE family RNA methyltransferase [Deltaproteobacteria bacterium]|nr:RlmE family RNA methyltransferase [Deltaproteobacteria bacterium]